ncbi:MAG: DNA-directed RNA polymerase subunit omega [Phycisphaerales bacterium]|nr:MAG: DNA-directed RNA polymerase subunit omega [Phycisphaerales bacterium]
MIEALKSDEIINRVGGRFKLTALIQKRWLELMQGARPMVDPEGLTEIEVVIEEIVQGKIGIDYDKSDIVRPKEE